MRKRVLFIFVVLVAAASGAAAQGIEVIGEKPVPCPPLVPKVALARRAPPTAKEYLALVALVREESVKSMKPKDKIDIDRALRASPSAGAGADIGIVLDALDNSWAGIYAITSTVLKTPDDAPAANNLGVALKRRRMYDRALQVLLVSEAATLDSPVVLSNLGAVAFALGDGGAAERYFRRALDLDPEHAYAWTGLGQLAACRNDAKTADAYFRRALTQMYLPAASAGLDIISDPDFGGASATGSSGNDRRASAQPIPHPGGKTGGGKPFVIPDPPFTASMLEVIRDANRLAAASIDNSDRASKAAERLPAMVMALPSSSPSVEGGFVVLPTTYEKELFVLRDVQNIFEARLERDWQPLEKVIGELSETMTARSDKISTTLHQAVLACGTPASCRAAMRTGCEENRALAQQSHARFYPEWNQLWSNVKSGLGDYYAFTTPWLGDIHNPAQNGLQNAERENFIRTHVTRVHSTLATWTLGLEPLVEDCRQYGSVAEEASPAPDDAPKTLSIWPDDPKACKSGSIGVSAGFASLDANCEKVKVEFGAGVVFVSAELKFGSDSASDEVTLYGGFGRKVKITGTPELGVDASGKLGAYVTIKDGKMVDNGVRGEAGVKATIGALQAETKAVGRVSGETGNTNVDVSSKGRVTIKAPN